MSAPRVAGIENPPGCPLGRPGDRAGQLAVLRATLQALASMTTPGEVRHLPFRFDPAAGRLRIHPPQSPPIARYLTRHPWLLPKFLNREIPEGSEAEGTPLQ